MVFRKLRINVEIVVCVRFSKLYTVVNYLLYTVVNYFNTTNATNLLSVNVLVAEDEENISTIT